MSFFFYTKPENRMVEQVLSREVGTSGRGEFDERCMRMNIVQILCTHVNEWKYYIC
jgi:hypothetical protein